MNKSILIGRLTKDVETRTTQGNTLVARFTLAVNRRMNREEADFINCVAFGKTAELLEKYFKKGSQLALEGEIRTGSYEAQDGTRRYTTEVAVNQLYFIGGNNRDDQESGGNYNNSFRDNNNGFNDNNNGFGGFNEDITPVDDGDMPF